MPERIEVVVRVTAQGLAEQHLGMLGQIGKRKALLGTFEFDEIAIKLNPVVLILPNSESQENRGVAGVALEDEADVFGFVLQ
jgi:hypothetical protein